LALAAIVTVVSAAPADTGKLELRLACEGRGFGGEYTIAGTTIAFESCKTDAGTVATVQSAEGDEIYRATGLTSSNPAITLYGKQLSLKEHSAETLEAIRKFTRSAEGRAVMCLQVEAQDAGLAKMSPEPRQWMALFLLSQAFEGVPRDQLPCFEAE
jgi:hypothetical protein